MNLNNSVLVTTNKSQFELVESLYPCIYFIYEGEETRLLNYEFVDDLLHNEIDFIECRLTEL